MILGSFGAFWFFRRNPGKPGKTWKITVSTSRSDSFSGFFRRFRVFAPFSYRKSPLNRNLGFQEFLMLAPLA